MATLSSIMWKSDVTYLFRLNGCCVDGTERKVSDGDVVKYNVEV